MRELTLDLVARFPRPGMAFPGRIAFAPDGTLFTYLHSERGDLRRVLWAMDPGSGDPRVLFDPGARDSGEDYSREEALRRERLRLRETGVTNYAWAERANVILVPLRGDAWIVTPDGAARRAIRDATDPALSPDGARAAFVRDGELRVADLATGGERRLTFDARPGVANGLAEFIAQEEMHRTSGFWWSRDGARIAYEQFDENAVPLYTIPHLAAPRAEFEHHRYPFAGAENAKVRLGVVPAEGGPTVWMDLGAAEYLARAAWHPDGRLFAQLQTRDQRRLELRAFDPRTGRGQTILVEESTHWINLNDDLRFLPDTGEFVWASERTGFKHLYLYRGDGTLVRAITSGEWPVDAVIAVDPKGRAVAFTGSRNPVERHVFVAGLDGGEPTQLTSEPGFHDAVFTRDFTRRVEVSESRERPPSVRLINPDRTVHTAAETDVPLQVPEIFEFESRDGARLYGMLYRPPRLPAPLVVHVYGGPGVQTVQDNWASTVDLRCQYLAAQGFLVMKVDNRGSACRGVAFAAALEGRFGTVEVRDQVDGVRWAQARGMVEGNRAGVMGWSYGGYLTLLCLLKAPEVFRAGVSGAPVTELEGYDTHYTERYMRRPEENPEGYREASAVVHADRLTGRLMLIHGMLDENVHFRHTARLVDALNKANKPYELLAYPGERHMPRSERDRRNMEERIVEFFRNAL